jgi:hypothetical protein
MPRRKRTSPILNKAEKRSVAIRSISETLDMGNGLSIENYAEQIQALRQLMDEYNMILSQLDRVTNDIIGAEKSLNDLSELMLMGVATTYGKDSNEYEMAGGVRKSERKRPVRSRSRAMAHA